LLARIGPEHGAPDAGMFVLASGAVGASADPEFDLSFLEVAEKLFPFGVGGFAVLLAGAQRPSTSQEATVMSDDVLVVDGDVNLSCG